MAVYLFFFKILGIFLFAVELAWFIALPVWRELKVWRDRRAEIPGSPSPPDSAGFTVLLLLAMPWKTGDGCWGRPYARQTAVFAPYPAYRSIHASGLARRGRTGAAGCP